MLFDFAANMEQKTLFQIKGCRNQIGVLILTVAITSMDLFLTMYMLQDSTCRPEMQRFVPLFICSSITMFSILFRKYIFTVWLDRFNLDSYSMSRYHVQKFCGATCTSKSVDASFKFLIYDQ